MKIGILALQGAFVEHEKMLAQLGVESIELRNLEDFQQHQSDHCRPFGEYSLHSLLIQTHS